MNTHLILILALISPLALALAGGSHYGTPAGIPAGFSGQVAEWSVPAPAFARAGGSAYAVTVDGAGIVWINEIRSDSVVRLDPRSNRLRAVKLPTPGAGIRKMIVDARGQLWYMGSQNGRLGRVR
jgi:streptogramin lyase